MAEQDLLYNKGEGVGTITLNRPQKLNALDLETNNRLVSICEEIRQDDEVRVVILTGAGRGFCSGTDISSGRFSSTTEAFQERLINEARKRTGTRDCGAIWALNNIAKPTVCAVNGPAVGLGAELTLLCDIRIASKSAKWGQVFVLRGVVPDLGAGTYLLPHIVGVSKACELVFSGEIIDADEMLRIGLVTKVVPDEELMPTAIDMANKLKRGAPLAVRMAKQLIYNSFTRSIEDHYLATRRCFDVASHTEDAKEGIKSFLEKREAQWAGR